VKPRRLASDTPELLVPRPTVTRRLDFSTNGDVTSGSESVLSKAARRKSGVRPRGDIYALEATEEEDEGRFTEEADLPVPDESLELLHDDYNADITAVGEPSELHQTSSPTRQRRSRASLRQAEISAPEPEEEEEEEVAPVAVTSKRKGKAPARRSLGEGKTTTVRSKAAQNPASRRNGKAALRSTKQQQAIEISDMSLEDSAVETSIAKPPPPKPAAKGRGKARARQLPTPEDTQPTADEPIETTELDDSVVGPPTKKRGRPTAKRKMQVREDSEIDHQEVSEIPDPEEATELERPAKRAKAAPTKAAPKKASKAPKERDPNIMPAPAFKKPELPVKAGAGARWDESMWANSRNMSRLRDPTPSAEAMVGKTRSGRQVIRPLNHFANERAQYGRDGTLVAVQTAENVEKDIPQRSRSRAASAAPARRGASRARGRPPMETTIIEEEEEEDDEEDLEDWEARGELIYGEVNGYDPLTGVQTGDQFETGMLHINPLIPSLAFIPPATGT
jgi:centromere protein C